MISVSFMPSFVRQMNQLENDLAEEALQKIELFKNFQNHQMLKVHKLHGALSGRWGFSVNYKVRIVFRYETKISVVFLAIGDHDVYK